MNAKCIFCGSWEPVPPEMQPAASRGEPMVCGRPECSAKAQTWGCAQIFSALIEAMELADGRMAFRLKTDSAAE